MLGIDEAGDVSTDLIKEQAGACKLEQGEEVT